MQHPCLTFLCGAASAEGALTPAGAQGSWNAQWVGNAQGTPAFTEATNMYYTLSSTSGIRAHIAQEANIGGVLTLSNGVVTFSPTANFTPTAPISFLYAVKDADGRGRINAVNILVLSNGDKAGVNATGQFFSPTYQ